MIAISNLKTNNLSFGLNAKNSQIINDRYSKINTPKKEDRTSALSELDMTDSDKVNVANFLNGLMEDSFTPPSDVVIAIEKSAQSATPKMFKEGYESLLGRWDKLFLSTRENLAKVLDNIGISHPEIGGLSRSTLGVQKDIVIRNIDCANDYIKDNVVKNECPDKDFLIELNRILTRDLTINLNGKQVSSSDYAGMIGYDLVCGVMERNEHAELSVDKICKYLQNNYDIQDIFHVCAKVYSKLLNIAPFYDANGRTSRAFIDAILQSKGYRINFPSNFAEIGRKPLGEIAQIIKENSEEI